MNVLLVQSDPQLASLWAGHLAEEGVSAAMARGQREAVRLLQTQGFAAVVLDLDLEEGCALAVADLIAYRWPSLPILFVTGRAMFADGSIFAVSANARAYLQRDVAPSDLTTLVMYFGGYWA